MKLGPRVIAPIPRAAAMCFAAIFEPEKGKTKRRETRGERKQRKGGKGMKKLGSRVIVPLPRAAAVLIAASSQTRREK